MKPQRLLTLFSAPRPVTAGSGRFAYGNCARDSVNAYWVTGLI